MLSWDVSEVGGAKSYDKKRECFTEGCMQPAVGICRWNFTRFRCREQDGGCGNRFCGLHESSTTMLTHGSFFVEGASRACENCNKEFTANVLWGRRVLLFVITFLIFSVSIMRI